MKKASGEKKGKSLSLARDDLRTADVGKEDVRPQSDWKTSCLCYAAWERQADGKRKVQGLKKVVPAFKIAKAKRSQCFTHY